ncbi:MarR family transcriptional regulator [Mycobacterium sp. ITM-2016-00318]|uniref:MarR family transcriptional regulator n=1 Tax=Mycobacterium sp. ITM-2016-00318 TaxID=2099693 RepID=UPI000CF8E4AD|nr:MarR family transcriptional regulator [Mycobacterium sp. ITM-2016-00318]WNG94077.1 MarR family transcriptional regulator [Mycobacterium sp. ITM-2016-00318]
MTDVRAGSPATELRESMMAVTRQMRRHRPDHGLTLSQLEVLGEVSRTTRTRGAKQTTRTRGAKQTGVSTPAEVAARLHVRVQSLTDSINELVSRGLVSRRPDDDDRRRQLVEITDDGVALLTDDRAERDAWLNTTMRENLTDLEFDLLMLVAPVLRKLAYPEGKVGTHEP